MANITNGLVFTNENYKTINGILEDYGFNSDVQVDKNGFNFGTISQNRDFVNIGHHYRKGFYIITSNRHIHRDDELEQYEAELQEAAAALRALRHLSKSLA
jgi:hypothetical protein